MKKITIGRNADNDIVILDQSVSGYHADLDILDSGEMMFTDHSTNGTMVNGNHLHNDYCRVFGTDDIIFPGQHKFDWTKVDVTVPIPAPAPAQQPAYQQPAPAPVQQPAYQQPAPAPVQQPAYQQPAPQYYQIGEIGFVQVLTNFWKNYFNFTGRARRKELWLMCVWNMIFGIVPVIGWLVILAGSIGYLSLAIRRLHDSGKSGWFLLLGLIPLVGAIILLVFYCQDSEKGQNKWGPSSKYINA